MVNLQSRSLLIFPCSCLRSQQPPGSLQIARNNVSVFPFASPKPTLQQRSWCRSCHRTLWHCLRPLYYSASVDTCTPQYTKPQIPSSATKPARPRKKTRLQKPETRKEDDCEYELELTNQSNESDEKFFHQYVPFLYSAFCSSLSSKTLLDF